MLKGGVSVPAPSTGVVCLSGSDGMVDWKFKTEDTVSNAVAVSTTDGLVFAGCNDYHMYAIATTTA